MSSARLGKAFCNLSFVCFCIYLLVTIDMALLYILSILSIVRMYLYSSIRSYNAHSLISWVSGWHCVSMVLIRCLPTNAPYIPAHVVDHGSDTPVESFVVHSPNIGQVGPSCEGRLALFLIFLSKSLVCRYKVFLPWLLSVIALIIVYSDMCLRMT
jgi:hypothetical protein